jgi:hypothetical protein
MNKIKHLVIIWHVRVQLNPALFVLTEVIDDIFECEASF